MPPARKKLGELLVEAGAVDAVSVQMALAQQARRGGRIGQVLLELNKITQDQLLSALAAQMGVQFVKLQGQVPQPQALALVPRDMAMRFNLVPLSVAMEGGRKVLTAASSDPTNAQMQTLVEQRSGATLRMVLAHEVDVARVLDASYAPAASAPPAAMPVQRMVPAPTFTAAPAARPGSLGAPMADTASADALDDRPTLAMDTSPAEDRGGAGAAEDVDLDITDPGDGVLPPPTFPPLQAEPPVDGMTVDLEDLAPTGPPVAESTQPEADELDPLADSTPRAEVPAAAAQEGAPAEDDGFAVDEGSEADMATASAAGSVFAPIPPDLRLQVMALIKQQLIEDELVHVFIQKGIVTETEVTRLRGSPLPRRG